MKVLVTGSAGHLGEALIRTLREQGIQPLGLDIKPSAHTDCVGSIVDRDIVNDCVSKVDAIIHTATLHKPHIGTHSRRDFIDTNVTGTLNLLEEAIANGCKAFVFTSTTSTYGDAMKPTEGGPAVWVTEALKSLPKNIYGVSKIAAEDLCQLFHRNTQLPCIVLKTSRFFPEPDDDEKRRAVFDNDNLKVNELLHRRADIADMANAHILALKQADRIGFARLIVTATTPFRRSDVNALRTDAPSVVKHYVPGYVDEYARRGWRMFKAIDRVYDNSLARQTLGWEPQYDFSDAIDLLHDGRDYRSELAIVVGAKGYHDNEFRDAPYPMGSF